MRETAGWREQLACLLLMFRHWTAMNFFTLVLPGGVCINDKKSHLWYEMVDHSKGKWKVYVC